jgi:putative transcriptional regulator
MRATLAAQMGSLAIEPGILLVAPPSGDDDSVFSGAVVVVVDCEPNGITAGLVLNRVLDQQVADASALALLYVDDLTAPAYWGGPMGSDPAILAQFLDVDGLEWFHLPKRMRRPFPLPDVGVIAVAEHSEPFTGRIRRARLYLGLSVWGRGQLESEVDRGAWRLCRGEVDDLFRPDPAALWADLQPRLAEP